MIGLVECRECSQKGTYLLLPCLHSICDTHRQSCKIDTVLECSFCNTQVLGIEATEVIIGLSEEAGESDIEKSQSQTQVLLSQIAHSNQQQRNLFEQHTRQQDRMNGHYLDLPSGLAHQGYYPDNMRAMPAGFSSEHSDDSFMSQIPLPYHVPGGGSFTGSMTNPPQHQYAAHGYQQNQQVPYNNFQQQGHFATQQQYPLEPVFNDAPGDTINYAHQYTGFTRQGSVEQGNHAVQPQFHGQMPSSQIAYQGNQYGTQMPEYHQPDPQYAPQMLHPYAQYHQGQQIQQRHVGPYSNNGSNLAAHYHENFGANSSGPMSQGSDNRYARPEYSQARFPNQSNLSSRYPQADHQLGRSQSTSNYNSRGQRQGYGEQGYAGGGHTHGRAVSQGYDTGKPHQVLPKINTAIDSNGRSVNYGAAVASNYPVQDRSAANPTSADSSISTESGTAASSFSHSKSVTFDKGSGVSVSSFDATEDCDKTPMKPAASSVSLPAQQGTTPHTLRSRKNQSIGTSTIKIDPVRGPPPAFWPKNSAQNQLPIASPIEQPSAQIADAQIGDDSNGPRNVRAGSDPFTTKVAMAKSFSGQDLPPLSVQPMSKASILDTLVANNVLKPLQTVPAGPLVLAQKPSPQGPSQHLASIAVGGKVPSVEVAFDRANMPFVMSVLEYSKPAVSGVVRISNIPYSVTRQEIVAFLGRNARLIHEKDEPIHIIMERVTSKTMDAYVEFVNIHEAVNSVNRYDFNRAGGRGGRLGERHVELEVVGHEQLMRDLFPKAKNVRWEGAVPLILPTDPNDIYNSGFQGFISREELVMLVKHVETPHRSPFSRECPQRPFECLISTLTKLPWYMVDYITLRERNALYDVTEKLFRLLLNRVQDEEEHISVDRRLLRRVQRAIFRCSGFNESMKDNIVFLSGLDGYEVGLAPFADHWRIWNTIGPKHGTEPDVLLYYQCLIREATEADSLAERYATTTKQLTPNIFGEVKMQYPDGAVDMSFADIAKIEWAVIEKLLRKRLAMGNIN